MYIRINGTKNGEGSIRYAVYGRAHNGKGSHRNCLITPINLLPVKNNYYKAYVNQMNKNWKRARKNHSIQMRRIVISFSKNEINPDNENDIEVANNIVKDFIKTYYPDREALLFYQKDGTGGCLHCHALVSDCSITDGKGCTRQQQSFDYIKRWINDVAEKYIKLDFGSNNKNRRTQTERALEEKAELIKNQNPDLSHDELQKVLIENKAFSYKDEMKDIIHACMESTDNEDDYFKALEDNGIHPIKKSSNKYGNFYLYDFYRCPIGVKNSKARSYKLGYYYGPTGIQEYWSSKNNSPSTHTANKDSDDFNSWLQETGQSYFVFDDNGKLISTDFDKMEKLHQEYEKYTAECLQQDHNQYCNDIAGTEMNQASFSSSTTGSCPAGSKLQSSKSILQQDLDSVVKLFDLTKDELERRKDGEQIKSQLRTRMQQINDEIPLRVPSYATQKELIY